MYAKLVLRNAKRSVKDYLVYIVTMTICVMLFYSFLSISSNYYQPDIGSEYNFTVLGDGMKVAICAITHGTAKFLNENGISATAVCWPDEQGDLNIMDMFSKHVFELVVNIPKDHSKRELTNGYKIRRAAIDHNIPLITNARLASAFISAFCNMDEKDIQIKSWQEYK